MRHMWSIPPKLYSVGQKILTKRCKDITKCNENMVSNTNNRCLRLGYITVDGEQVETVDKFKYLGRFINTKNNDWMTIIDNLKKARKQWSHVRKFLLTSLMSMKTSDNFYKTIVKSTLLYGFETWVPSGLMWIKLKTFHKKVSCGNTRTPPTWIRCQMSGFTLRLVNHFKRRV